MSKAKDKIRKLLRTKGYEISWITPNQVNGIDFNADIKLLIKNENPVLFDIGANEGQTIEMFRRIFSQPRIYAFEPSHNVFQTLEDKYSNDSLISLHKFALGETNTAQEFINYERSVWNSFLSLDENIDSRLRDNRVVSKETVEIKTLDWFIKENNLREIDLLKIDTQGYDLRVLKGATDSFKQGLISNVFVEINFVKLYQNQSDAIEIIEFLSVNNLSLVDYYEKKRLNQTLAWCTALFTKK